MIPLRSSLPEQCYNILPSTGDIIITKKGEDGFFKTDISFASVDDNRKLVDEYNASSGVSKAQAAAMLAGSMFGWKCPAADPQSYNEDGILKKPKFKDRGMEL